MKPYLQPTRIALFLLLTLWGSTLPLAGADRKYVKTRVVSRGHLEKTVRQSVILYPFETVMVHARITGYAEEVLVDIGDEVKKDDVLVSLDVPEMVADVEIARAESGTARANVNRAEAMMNLRKTERTLTKTLYDKGGRTQFQLDEADAQLKLAEAEVELAEASQLQAEAKVDRILVLVSYSRVRAPFNGVITERNVDTGALVREGTSGDAPALFEIQRTDRIRCRVDIPEKDALFLLGSLEEKTLEASLSIDAMPGQVFEYSAEKLHSLARFSKAIHPRSHHMTMEIFLDNKNGRFIPGFYGYVELRGKSRETVLAPNIAIQAPRRAKPFVYVVEGPGETTVVKKEVELGASNGTIIEVTSGLSAGDRVVVRGAADLVNGQTVNAEEEKKS